MGGTEHLPASCPLFPGGGGLRPCSVPSPGLRLSRPWGGRARRDAAGLGRGAAGGPWSNRPAPEKWLPLRGGFAELRILSSPFPACCRGAGTGGPRGEGEGEGEVSKPMAGRPSPLGCAPKSSLFHRAEPLLRMGVGRWVTGPRLPSCLQVC